MHFKQAIRSTVVPSANSPGCSTNGSSRVAVTFSVKPTGRGTVYWRWYSAENDLYRAAASSKVRIVTP